jgi:hypothetical protein
MVILLLRSPRRKRRGEGLSLYLELSWFDDRIAMMREGKPLYPGVDFPRTHGVERMQLDPSDARRPSPADRFAAQVSVDPFASLNRSAAAQLALRVRP